MSGADPIQRLDFNDEEIDVDEDDESGYIRSPLYNKIYGTAEKFAGTYAGQYATGKIDSLLKLIEATAKWSLPPRNNSGPSTPLERPLPWIPFIALILMLRIVRIGLSIAGLFIGNAPIVPSDVVYFIQTRRRKLRAIRIAGMREIRKKEADKKFNQLGGVLSRLTSIMSMAMCRPKLGEDSQKILLNENCVEVAGGSGVKKTQQNHTSSKHQCFEDEDVSDSELTFGQILDKYGASSNEEDDSDFIPPSDALNDSETSSASTSTATSDEEKNDEEEIESTENVATQSISNTDNPNSDIHMTNGNISIENQDRSVSNKENGEHLDKKLRKPKIMPKPIKDEPMPPPIQEVKKEQAVCDEDTNKSRIEFENSEGQNLPLPIQEIKQEPLGSDEETNRTKIEFENSESLNLPVPIHDIKQEPAESDHDTNISNDSNPNQKQQYNVEFENDGKELNSMDITENGKDQEIEKINGNQKLLQPEIFVTPATSAEDLFLSPVGSPDLCGVYGFQPTSILKNCQAVNLEKRGHTEAFAENEDFIKGERTNELEASSRPAKNANHTGKPIKNKFRGKRR